uniref:PIH1D1/2/3 CS-like domain-containing protein n=1 Tax=Chlamydomonas leiostraca TaxID=1034604 RepID=A0A7S0RPW7_9CHLO|mmetsp:Transcript_27692/g.70550  ORF Transcript_27692/g.70550 Transcript_27692/m.70550 type:complete len:386 (+) Transcript_27692:317-1474(+)
MDELMNVAARMGGPSGSGAGGVGGAMPELAGTDMRALSQQADTLWRFLDGLAESDPAEYARFIEKQAAAASKEAVQSMAVPVRDAAPALVVEVPVTRPRAAGTKDSSARDTAKGPLLVAAATAAVPLPAVIHVWAAKEGSGVPPARTTHGEVGLGTASWVDGVVPLAEVRPAREAGGALHCHAAVHARTVDLAVQGSPPQLRALLVAAACQWVERSAGARVAGEPLLKVAGALLAPPPTHAGHPAAPQLTHCTTPGAGVAGARLAGGPGVAAAAPSARAAGSSPGRPLITDMSPRGRPTLVQVHERPQQGGVVMVVEVAVPGATSARELELELEDEGGRRLRVTAHGHSLLVPLPHAADPDTCSAKFDAGSSTVRVTLAASGSSG